ncbi:MAG: hypothetical protein M3Z75_22065 [Actinomycetota bacterium]|nr:hypothetical protein [Actinomycetota bacterium]
MLAVSLAGCGGPSYPHAWCGPVIGTLTSAGGTQTALEASLGADQHAGALVGRLLNGLFAYGAAREGSQRRPGHHVQQNMAAEHQRP